MIPKDDITIEIESFKTCIEAERYTEKLFIRYSIVTIITIVIVRLSKIQPELTIPILGKIPNNIIIENSCYIIAFLILLMCYGFLGWVLALIDLYRHPIHDQYSDRKSLVVVLADKWDNFFNRKYLYTTCILDILQNIIFLLMFIIFIILLLREYICD